MKRDPKKIEQHISATVAALDTVLRLIKMELPEQHEELRGVFVHVGEDLAVDEIEQGVAEPLPLALVAVCAAIGTYEAGEPLGEEPDPRRHWGLRRHNVTYHPLRYRYYIVIILAFRFMATSPSKGGERIK